MMGKKFGITWLLVTFLLAGSLFAFAGVVYAFAPDTDLSDADASFWGEDSGDWSGWSVACAGDVNGDGYDDFLIGAPNNEDGGADAGQTYLILGSAAADWGMDFNLSSANASFIGEDSYDWSGWSVASAGDVNGDGYDDFLIGAYQDEDGGIYAGQTYLILGSAAADWGMDFNLSNANASFIGEDSGDWSGGSVACAGDVNGDGYDDFLIGASDDEDGGSGAGQSYLILGSAAADWGMDFDLSDANASFWGEDAGDHSGWPVASAGDVNGDGYDDFLIGASNDEDGGADAGQTYLILGRAAADWGMDFDLSNANASFWGEDSNDYSGYSVACAGDVNNDTYDDFLIGAVGDEEGGDQAGQTYLLLGDDPLPWGMDFDLSNANASFWGEDAGDCSGCSVACAGDVNGDGLNDFLIGAEGDEDGGTDAGQTYLTLGRAAADWGMDFDLSDANASFWGEDAGDHSGGSVASAGDVNGDGYDDFLIGASNDEDGGTDAGQTYLWLGTSPATLEGHASYLRGFLVRGFEPGNLTNELWNGTATTNNTGVFTITNLTPGTYDIGIKNWTSLSELETNVTLTAGNTTVVDFDTTREGDANNDDWVTCKDFDLLVPSYGTWEGGPGWDPHCDFNRNGWIDAADFAIMIFNWGQRGDLPSEGEHPGGDGWGFEIQPNMSSVEPGENFTVNITAVHYSGDADCWAMYLLFNTTYLEVTGIDTPSASPFVNESSNTAGWAQIGYGLFSYINETFVHCTIHFRAKSVNGTSYLNFTWLNPRRGTEITRDTIDHLNWSYVVNGTVEVGHPALTVDVSPAGGGNVTVNGATPPGYPNTTTWNCSENVTLNAVAASGYTFESCWSGNLSGNTTPVDITMDSDKSVTAHFTPLYNLTVISDGCCPIDVSGAVNGTISGGENQTFTGIVEGDNVTVSADDSDVCCEFDSWSDAGEKTHTITMDSDESVTAYCSVPGHNLTVNVSPVGDGNVMVNGATPPSYPSTTMWVCGDNVTLNATAASGYCFVNWSGDLSGSTNPTDITMDSDKDVTAHFTPCYKLTVTSDSCCPINVSGAVSGTVPSGGSEAFTGIVEGESVTVSADDSAVCCKFDSWSDAGAQTHVITMDSDKSITAYCSVLNYNLTVNLTVNVSPVGGGNVTVNGTTPPGYPNTTTWNCSESVTLNATAVGNYSFVSWSGDLSGNTNPTNITMYGNYTIVANFAEAATLEGHVNLSESRGAPGSDGWIERYEVHLFEYGGAEWACSPINATTNNTGVFFVYDIPPGTYNISIKNWTCLREVKIGETFTAGQTTVVDFGVIWEGDADNNNYIMITDLGCLLLAWNAGPGNPDYRWYYDMDRNGYNMITDLGVMLLHWNKEGAKALS